ncbi:MAG: aminotransferase class V-fold PLP-dependent enzyme [Thermoanaerobaculia bacterium]
MTLDRRELLERSLGAAALLAACGPGRTGARRGRFAAEPEWEPVRAEFDLDPDVIHMSALLLSSHPRPVREAIARYRRELDRNPTRYLQENNDRLQTEAIRAAAAFAGASSGSIALTDSTTMGLGLVYNGLRLAPGDEVLTTRHDYYATHESLRLASMRTGAHVREIDLYDGSPAEATPEEIVARIAGAITPATRAVALTWVHSGTGLKIPVADISAAVRRTGDALVCVDGDHGFGVESVAIADLGCDFFMAGAHKWMFGPRGTGIVWASERGLRHVLPTIPSFMDDGTWQAWIEAGRPAGPPDGRRLSPGGFKPFEHQWAMKDAFAFHEEIGRDRIEAGTRALASRLRRGSRGWSTSGS